MLRSAWLGTLLLLVVALLVLAAQLPQRYGFDVGYEEGYNSDLPFVSGFYPFEPEDRSALLNWRWTTDRALVELPGFGMRPVMVTLKMLPVNLVVFQNGAKTFEVWSNNRLIGTFPVIQTGAFYRFVLPPSTNFVDRQGFEIRNATYEPPGDARSLGIPIDQVQVQVAAGPTLPSLEPTLVWLIAVVLAWCAVRSCGFSQQTAFTMLVIAVVLLGTAAILDPPRAAWGALPAVTALAWGWLLVLVLRAGTPALARKLAIPLDGVALRWLLLLALVGFTLRYGGKIFPGAMWGDIGFHTNRFTEVVQGRILLLSRNRGVDFPYPPAFYLLLAPFILLGFPIPMLLQLCGAMLDAFSPFLVYTIAACAYAAFPLRAREEVNTVRWPLLAAALYSLSAATFMTTWWNFSTHIFTQFAHLLLITAVVVCAPKMLARGGKTYHATHHFRAPAIALAVISAVVFLGHFGFWMNMSLLGGIGLAVACIAAWRSKANWRGVWGLALAFVTAESAAALLFYSAYTGLFLNQIRAAQAGGLTGMAGRAPVARSVLWTTLWDSGFRVHFGFFPVPLAAGGLVLLLYGMFTHSKRDSLERVPERSTLVTLVCGTLLIACGFAVLPFLSGSTLSTRWLMFSAWVIAILAIYLVRATWQWGWPARVIYALMACYILWNTASQWVSALAYRIRPPEPF